MTANRPGRTVDLTSGSGRSVTRRWLRLAQSPFEGILRRDSIHSAGSVLDLAAVLALVGWTILELIVVWVVGIFRREPA